MEIRAFRVIVCLIAVIPLVAGMSGAFGGIDGLAAVVGEPAPTGVVAAGLRNHLRAIAAAFVGFGLLMVWAAFDLEKGKTAFRLGTAAIVAAGAARVTGAFVDGAPGVLALVFAAVELAGFPLLLVWNARLVRRA